MAQKQWEERLETSEKEIRELKEMILSMHKSIENLTEEVKESSRTKQREESCASEGSGLKKKGKEGETDMNSVFTGASSDRSKYKKLEMPIITGDNSESWVYRAEHYFDINELADEEKVKVAVISFGQDEVNWFLGVITGRQLRLGMISRKGCSNTSRLPVEKVWGLVSFGLNKMDLTLII